MGIAACCARAASGHAAEQRDELASLHPRNHSITSSHPPFAERKLMEHSRVIPA